MDLEIKNKILSYLRMNDAVSASDIAKAINHNRITVGKYLQILEAKKLVVPKKVASAIHWQLVQTKTKILIVDDEKHIVDLIRLSLGDTYEIFEAYDGEQAIRKVNEVMPNLIVLDIMMPKRNGFEVCEEIKKNASTHDIAILMLSAKGAVEDKVKAMELGADDYVVKPFDPLELEARVSSILRRSMAFNSKNSITGLPNKILTEEMKNHWRQNNNVWNELQVTLCNFEGYINEFGHKKGFEVIKLFSRLLADEYGDENSYVGHLDDNTFVVFSKSNLDSDKLEKKFNDMLPFLYTQGQAHNKIFLNCEVTLHD